MAAIAFPKPLSTKDINEPVSSSEEIYARTGPRISWKAIFGGLFISLLSYWFLLGIGIGVGAFGLKTDQVTLDIFKALTLAGAAWMVISHMLALALGAYATLRISNYSLNKSGVVQGAITASIYFAIMSLQVTAIAVPFTKGIFETVEGTAQTLMQQPKVQNFLEDSVNDLNVSTGMTRADLSQALGARLMSNDTTSLRTFIARNSNLSAAEIDARIAQMDAEFRAVVTDVSNAAGTALAFSAWLLVITLGLGAVSAIVGGIWGARSNQYSQ